MAASCVGSLAKTLRGFDSRQAVGRVPEQALGLYLMPGKVNVGASRYRVELPRAENLEGESGHFEATEYAERRTGWLGHRRDVEDHVVGSTMSSMRSWKASGF